MISFPFITVIILISMSFFALVFKKNLLKLVMAIHIMASGVNLFLITLGYRQGGVAPIFTNTPRLDMVLPTVQALTLTSIVINIAIVALMLSLAILIYHHYGSLDTRKRKLKQ